MVPILVLGLTVGVYRLQAQELPPSTDGTTEETPVTTSPDNGNEETIPSVEGPEDEEDEENDGGLLGDIVDFVEEVIDGDQDEVLPVEEPIVEELPPVIEPEIPDVSPPIIVAKPLIPFRGEVNIKKKDIDYTNGSYKCNANPFSVNISHAAAQSILKIENINQVGESERHIEIGELPVGLKVVFPGDTYRKSITGTETEFAVSVVKDMGAQKGSFTVPIFYSVGNITVMCQMNVVNNG